MRYTEVAKMERQEKAYNLLLFKLTTYNEQLDKVTLYRKKNSRGRLVSSIVCYLVDNADNVRIERFKLYDDEYLWFACALQQDFPEVPFDDLTNDKAVSHAV
jgi:hypothetical protein